MDANPNPNPNPTPNDEAALAAAAAAEAAKAKTKPAEKLVKVRVLAECSWGPIGTVALVPKAVADAGGDVDANPAAVAYAESLKP